MLELNAALGPLQGRREEVCVCVSFITAAPLQILYLCIYVLLSPPPPCCHGLVMTVRKQDESPDQKQCGQFGHVTSGWLLTGL